MVGNEDLCKCLTQIDTTLKNLISVISANSDLTEKLHSALVAIKDELSKGD